MAGVKGFKKIALKDRQISKFQDNVEQVFASILRVPTLDGVLLRGIELVSGQPNLVDHKLSREPLGWFITRKRANSIVWDEQDSNTFKTKSIDLRCSANIVVDIYIF